MTLEYFDIWDCSVYGLSQACTAGITEPLWLNGNLVCKYSTYFLQSALDESYQPNS